MYVFPDEEPQSRPQARLPWGNERPYITWALLAVNILVFIAATLAGGTNNPQVLLDFGALFGPLIADGEYWRLFTAMFLHIGLAHLAFNGFALLIFGGLVERLYGHVRFIIIYMLAGLAGSVASYLFSHSLAIGAGASGAIFGIMGALAAFFAIQRDVLGTMGQRNLTAVLVLAGLNLLYGLLTPGIDNWAHMGGFVGGVLLGLGLAPRLIIVMSPLGYPERLTNISPISKRWWVIPIALVVLAAGVWLGTATLPDNVYSHLSMSERYQKQERFDMALQEVNTALEVDQSSGDAYLQRGLVYYDMGDLSNARADFVNAFKYGDVDTKAIALEFLRALDTYQQQ